MHKTAKQAFVPISPWAAAVRIGMMAVGLALASQAHAAPRPGLYVAALVTPSPTPRQEVVDGLLWKCAGGQCSAPAQGGRPAGTCARVARKLGEVARFASPQGELSADELARCNAAR